MGVDAIRAGCAAGDGLADLGVVQPIADADNHPTALGDFSTEMAQLRMIVNIKGRLTWAVV
jgi:hypothetical protein